MADETGGVTSLLTNKLFLQMLAGAGQDVASNTMGNAQGMPGLSGAIQGNIQSQNYAKLLKQLLGSDGTKGTFSKDGINLTIPKESSLYGSFLGGDQIPVNQSLNPFTENSVSPSTPNPGQVDDTTKKITNLLIDKLKSGASVANPFVEGQSRGMNLDFNAADLAGLTTQDISTALGLKLKQDEVKNQSVQHVLDNLYKTKLMENIDSEVEARKPKFEIPGIGKVNATQYLSWEKMNKENKPNEAKLYEYAIKQGFSGSFMDFEDRAKTTHKKDYDEAVKGGYKGNFNGWMLDLAKAGAINLGEFTKREEAKKTVKAESYFSTGEFNKDIEKRLDNYRKNELWQVPEAARPAKEAEFKVKNALDELSARGYTIDQKYWLDKEMTTAAIDVTSKSGNKETIKIRVK